MVGVGGIDEDGSDAVDEGLEPVAVLANGVEVVGLDDELRVLSSPPEGTPEGLDHPIGVLAGRDGFGVEGAQEGHTIVSEAEVGEDRTW